MTDENAPHRRRLAAALEHLQEPNRARADIQAKFAEHGAKLDAQVEQSTASETESGQT